jgi:serine phosphatase RsbU (regulator of sigma subunit)
MEIHAAVAKINKYSTSESGDTLEIVERPNGGISIVLADGQTSGKGAKTISTMVVRKVISLLAEGVRDGAAARAASDYLFTERSGKVTATLNILSADLQSGTLVITRNNPSPVILARRDRVECITGECVSIGTSRNIRPSITEFPLESGITIIMFTDGIRDAGDRTGQSLDLCTLMKAILEDQEPTAQEIADIILGQAIRMDNNRPNDDMSVVVLRTTSTESDQIRRMTFLLPVPPMLIPPQA